ncbi:MAG: outer membrane lipoprotein carrier protein LolA [Flavobacteriales bacterium]|nr:outer membrane lipoprotein carrier protein LolA [Flavobacteriales bacterium]
MKQILLATFAFLTLIHTTQAQDDARSRALLDDLMAKAKGWTSFEADFSSRLQNTKDKLDVKQEGNMKVKGQKFRLILDKNTIINDGTTIYTYNKESNEVNLSDPAEMDQELDPSKLFTQYEKGFKSSWVSEKPDAAGAVVQTIKLFPVDPAKKAYHTVVISVNKAKMEPTSIEVLYKDGNSVTYHLKKFTANPELGDALFTFDKAKYPGVEVNDMR